jgi:L-rhamnono-1,4-lactonase
MASSELQFPIIDSHIHLYPSSELETLAWYTPESPLAGQKSLDEYTRATNSAKEKLEGFIFLETDRKHDLEAGVRDGSGWKYPLMEVDWLRRIATGQPKAGEGHAEEHAKLCLAIIPWAPVSSGADALEKYVDAVSEAAGDAFGKVRGFRYLVQDKPEGTMGKEGFVDGVKWLGRKGYVFDLGVDQRSGGLWQLEAAVEMIERAHAGVDPEDKTTIIISE